MSRLTLLVLAGAAAFAQNVESWVSLSGNDANACTLAAPCRTFQAAHNKTNDGGAIFALGNGDFGPVNITKSVTLDGSGSGAVIQGTSASGAVDIVVTGKNVAVRNLTVHACTNCIGFAASLSPLTGIPSTLHLENITVYGDPDQNALQVGADQSSQITMRNVSTIGGFYGISTFMNAPGGPFFADLDHVAVRGASTSGFIALRGDVAIHDSNFSENPIGVSLIGPSTMTLDRVSITQNTTGIHADNSTVRLSNSVIAHNNAGIDPANISATVISFRNNLIYGNVTDGAPSLSVSLK